MDDRERFREGVRGDVPDEPEGPHGDVDRAAVAPSDRRTAFEVAAALLMPAEPARCGVIVEADTGWEFAEGLPADADVVVWGRPPLRGG
ncbi:MAG: hypothetical protein ACRDYX_21985, partial [Egibacteraceae bacterium]